MYHKKKHKKLTTNPLICFYIYRINNRLVFKIKDTYKLELQTMKLLGSTKKIIDKIKNGEIMPSLEVVELVVVQCNLAGN